MARRLVLYCTVLALAASAVLPWMPAPMGLTKLAWMVATTAAWAGLLTLFWKRRWARAALLLMPLVAVMPFCLPGRAIDTATLRDDYVRRLVDLEGTAYVWGGESRRGIDCSGLPRRAYRDALLLYGLRHANGRAIRGWAEQWWFDASARALGEGYRNHTTAVNAAGPLSTMEYAALRPGDMAVTRNGVHVLVYLGDNQWINADPGAGAVVTFDGRTGTSGWRRSLVTAHRWRELQEP